MAADGSVLGAQRELLKLLEISKTNEQNHQEELS